MSNIIVGLQHIGINEPTYFIADIAANHDGEISRAKELIHMAAEAGAHAAKFQNFKASTIVSDYGFKSLGQQFSHQKKWEKSVFEVYSDASIPDEWTIVLRDECNKAGIHYSTSPYDIPSIKHATPYVDFFKVGSGDLTWTEIYLEMAKSGKPVFISTGASTMQEVERAMASLTQVSSNIVLMQCNTNYTGSSENFKNVNLNVLTFFSKRWPNVVLGFSDHTQGHAAVLGAVTLGARVVEKHFTDCTQRKGPDHAFSLTPVNWREMVERTRELEYSLGDGVKRIESNEKETVILQRRSLRAIKELKAGHIITANDFFPLRPAPAEGIAPWDISLIMGKKLIFDLQKGEHITLQHVW